ncbi:peptidoglycan-binding protein [Streptomyces sp. NPDC003720]|uniref:peptidoglycan-binding protein n=1 Tax=Streptomyces sp. NPDC003720 TaxID=3364684 RepID=UPI0036A2A1E2
MTESSGHTCPECGAPRGPDNTPSCDCTERASRALRETRTAEAAAAEDFDPLRIRPYVEMGDPDGAGAPGPAGQGSSPNERTPAGLGGEASAGDSAVPADGGGAGDAVRTSGPAEQRPSPDGRTPAERQSSPNGRTSAEPDGDAVRVSGPAEQRPSPDGRTPAERQSSPNGRTSAEPGEDAVRTSGPAEQRPSPDGPTPAERQSSPNGRTSAEPDGDAVRVSAPAARGAVPDGSGARRLPPPGDFGAQPFPGPAGSAGRTRRRRTALLCIAGAGVVAAAVGLAGGLFSYQEPTRDRSAPQVRESVPEEAPTSPGSAFSSEPASPSAARLPAPGTSAPGTATPSASRGASRPAPSGTASAGSLGPTATALVLRRGDQGLEVIDLQTRLSALNLYPDHIDGVYTRPVEDAVRTYQLARGISGDTPGVYGTATRAKLESETW